ncbi:MAG: flavin reductase family protein [Candidatus Acidiferrum sp.]|jgi:flavin reductase (DIM6/NTAB) family NADH-FMN oxidoreductase RutF
MTTPAPTQLAFRQALGQFATGVTVVTVEYQPGKIHGMTANSFTSVSLEPLLVLVCVDHRALMLPFLHEQKRFGVSVLKEHQQALAEFFAQPGQNEDAEERLNIRFRRSPSGIPMIEDTLARVSCRVAQSYVSGDHTVFLGEVETVAASEGQPLLFFRGRYRQLGA